VASTADLEGALVEHLVAALVARRFYLENRTKKQIGDELGISRFKVARVLEQAVREGIVRIEIDVPPEVDLDLSQQVANRFGLRQVLVVRAAEGLVPDEAAEGSVAGDQQAVRRQLGRACAALLAERLSDDDVLGVSWGRTLHALTDVMPPLARATVVQIVGSVPSADLSINSLQLLRRLGESTKGTVHALHVPMVLDSAEVAATLRQADYVAATLARFSDITCALVGIGAWRPGGSSLRSALPAAIVADLDAAGAVADVCSTVLDAGGEVVGGDSVPSRCIAITTEQLRAVPDVIGLAGGADKAAAIAATLRTGLLHRLITDSSAAAALLRI
jgi:DNA-binding transcriptional regulator LsrR (DeoR family)